MRASVIATLIFAGLLAIGLRGLVAGKSAARAHAQDNVVIIENHGKRVTVNGTQAGKTERAPFLKETVSGEYKSSSAEALDDALNVAAEKIGRHLRSRTRPIEWTPPPEFVRKHLLRNVKEDTREVSNANAPLTYRATIEVEITNDGYQKIVEEERKARVEQRMWCLARIVGGLVLILVAIAGYIRLDDVTKGYYSIPLRIGAIVLGVAGAVVLWWIV